LSCYYNCFFCVVFVILSTDLIHSPIHRRQTDCKCVFEPKSCQNGRRDFAPIDSHLFYGILVMCHKQDAAVQVAPGAKLQPGGECQRSTKLGKPPTPGHPGHPGGPPPPPTIIINLRQLAKHERNCSMAPQK